jgi:hypothetical protein
MNAGCRKMGRAIKARNRSVRSNGLCYLCGDVSPDSRYHIVAVGFFSQPFPPNLVTLRAHQRCQATFSDSEDYVRNILAGLASGISGVPHQARRLVEHSTGMRHCANLSPRD